MELLDDMCHMESCFGPFEDESASSPLWVLVN